MKKASEYRKHAQECRDLAKHMRDGPELEQCLLMARYWEQMAVDRTTLVHHHPDLAIDGEHEEEKEHARPGKEIDP